MENADCSQERGNLSFSSSPWGKRGHNQATIVTQPWRSGSHLAFSLALYSEGTEPGSLASHGWVKQR